MLLVIGMRVKLVLLSELLQQLGLEIGSEGTVDYISGEFVKANWDCGLTCFVHPDWVEPI